MRLIQPLKFRTLKTGCFKTPRLQTPRLQTDVFQTGTTVASGKCPIVTLIPLCNQFFESHDKTCPRGNCNPRLENDHLQTGHFQTPRFQCSELQRLD